VFEDETPVQVLNQPQRPISMASTMVQFIVANRSQRPISMAATMVQLQEKTIAMMGCLDGPGLHLDFLPQYVLTLKWNGPTVNYNKEWTDFDMQYLSNRLSVYRDAAIPQGKCRRYCGMDADPDCLLEVYETGKYVGVSLTENGKTMGPNLHHLSHFVDTGGEHIKELNDNSKITFVISHYCSHKDCSIGTDGRAHCGIEPQSVNINRKKCWALYLDCLDTGDCYHCKGHAFYAYGKLFGNYPPCIFTYPEDLH